MVDDSNRSNWLLAIDTSTEQAGLALTNGQDFAEVSWLAGRNQTTAVLPQVDALLSLAGIGPGDLSAITVATGPGMFNGLRVGMSLAKGFVLGRGVPLIGISTLALTMAPWQLPGHRVIGLVAAGRGRYVWQNSPGDDVLTNGSVAELRDQLLERELPTLVVGDLTAKEAGMLAEVPGVIIPMEALRRRRPSVLAELGWARYLRGDTDDPVLLEPTYVHSATQAAR